MYTIKPFTYTFINKRGGMLKVLGGYTFCLDMQFMLLGKHLYILIILHFNKHDFRSYILHFFFL